MTTASATPPMPPRAAGSPPAIALGCMNFGKRTDPAESERIVRRAIERGIRIFDTANAYNGGESERILGRALGRDRGRVVVATKVGSARAGGKGAHKAEGLAPAVVEREIAASLGRLGTDYVDVYYLHVPDHAVPIDETLGAMKAIVGSGRARAWGVSNYAAWQILEMNGIADGSGMPRPVVSQVLYNLLHRQLEVEYFAFTRRHPIHTTVYNPLAGGLLAGTHRFDEAPPKNGRFDDNALYRRRYWTRPMFERVEQLRAVAQSEGLTMVQLATAWVAARPEVDSILVGPANVAQLDDAIDAAGRTLSDGARAKLAELGRDWAGTDTNYVR